MELGRNSGPRELAYLLSGLRLFMGNFKRWLDLNLGSSYKAVTSTKLDNVQK